jgi:hypothetical protein
MLPWLSRAVSCALHLPPVWVDDVCLAHSQDAVVCVLARLWASRQVSRGLVGPGYSQGTRVWLRNSQHH